MAKKDSAEQLVTKVQGDKLLRARLVSKLTDALQEMGIKREDMTLIPPLDEKSTFGAGTGGAQIVIITRSDSKKNTKSIIVW